MGRIQGTGNFLEFSVNLLLFAVQLFYTKKTINHSGFCVKITVNMSDYRLYDKMSQKCQVEISWNFLVQVHSFCGIKDHSIINGCKMSDRCQNDTRVYEILCTCQMSHEKCQLDTLKIADVAGAHLA